MDKTKLGIWMMVIVIMMIGVYAANYDYKYSPYTGKQDRTLAENQSGQNFTMDWTGLVNYPTSCPSYSAITQLDDSVTCTDYKAGFFNKYTSGNFNGSLYNDVQFADSTASDSNSLFQIVSDTRRTPQFLIQNGGPSQASFIARSFMIVNQNNTRLNSSMNNICSSWGFEHLDCNTSTTGADFGVTDDIEATGLIYSGEGLRSHSTSKGAYLVLNDHGSKYIGVNGEYDDSTSIFCDYTSDNFVNTGGWVTITDEMTYTGAYGDINVFINSSCVELKNNPAWTSDFSNVKWEVVDSPSLISQKGGFFEYYVGNDEQSQFEIRTPNGTGFTGVYFKDDAGADQHQAFTIDMDVNNYEGTVAQNIFMTSSTQMVNKDVTMILLEGDASTMNNSRGTFTRHAYYRSTS